MPQIVDTIMTSLVAELILLSLMESENLRVFGQIKAVFLIDQVLTTNVLNRKFVLY